jgi:signal transduction histidine kinase
MLDFARQKPPRRVATDVSAVLRATLELLERQFVSRNVGVETAFADDLPPVTADPDQIQQVFLNLALNAVDAMPSGGTLHISARLETVNHPEREGAPAPCVAIAFADTGTGIPEADRSRVFDPFFTTKDPGRGTGLGLSVSYGIIEEHGGWLDLQSRVGEGTCFTVHLPVEPATSGATT